MRDAPKINERSRLMAQKGHKALEGCKVEDRLLLTGLEKQAQMTQRRVEKEYSDVHNRKLTLNTEYNERYVQRSKEK